jgi:hypothetical protein
VLVRQRLIGPKRFFPEIESKSSEGDSYEEANKEQGADAEEAAHLDARERCCTSQRKEEHGAQ